MSYEIPPLEGSIYRGRSGSLRRVVKVHGMRRIDMADVLPRSAAVRWSYEVEWAPAKNALDYFGTPRKLKAWCSTWESWVKERVRADAAPAGKSR